MTGVAAFALPLALALAGAVGALALDGWVSARAATWCAGAGLLAAAVAAGVAAASPSHSAWGVFATGGVFSALLAAVLGAGAIALLGGIDELHAHPRGGAIAALAALAALSAGLAPASLDVIALLLAIEVASLCAYAIVALGRHDGSTEAAVRYFVQGSVATALFVAGSAVLVGGLAGRTSFQGILAATHGSASSPIALGVVLLGSALAFKAGAFPFHSWVPDAYETAPAAGAGVMASAVKSGAIAAVLILVAVLGVSASLSGLLAAIAVGSILFGNLAALRQRSLARMLGYSGIAQAGYAFVPLVVAGGAGKAAAFASAATLFFVVTYAVAVAGAFSAVSALTSAEEGWDGSIASLAGLGERRPLLAGSLAVLLLSLTGVPPLLGFFGKLYAFTAAITGGWWPLALIGLLGSAVSFGYYGYVLRAMYFEEPPAENDAVERGGPAGRSGTVAATAAAGIVLVGGLAVLVAGQPIVLALFGAR